MEIRRWCYYVLFNCILIKYLGAKTISLNEVIAAESRQKETFKTTLPTKLKASTGKHYSIIKRLTSTSRVKKFLESGHFLDNTITAGKISPLKYKKTFLIKSPLRPKKLKLLQKSRYKRKNQSAKREINGNEELKQKYIPVLKSLSMLFDNLLNSDASESYEVETKKFKRNRFYYEDIFKAPHKCSYEPDCKNIESQSQEKTITFAPTLTTETSIATENVTIIETTTTSPDSTTTRNFSAFRQNKNIPILLPRDTFSGHRIDNGISESNSTPLYGNVKRNITRHYGDNEHASGGGKNESRSEDNEKGTHGFTRDSAGGFQFSRANGNRNYTRLHIRTNRTKENYSKNKTTIDNIRENQFENRGNQTKSTRLLQEPIRGLPGFTTKQEFLHPQDVQEESFVNDTYDISHHQRIIDRGSSIAIEDQKVRQRNETVTSVTESVTQYSKSPQKKVVMIFDGYSIARHKNGENKFSEKTIRIHS